MKRLLAALFFVACLLIPTVAWADTTAAFTDDKLYAAVKDQLTSLSVTYTPNDTAKSLTLTDSERDKVTSLDLVNKNIKNTTGLEAFTSLTSLDLAHNYVSDISGLQNLTSLTSLNLYDNAVRNFTDLQNLTALTSLNLGQNNETSTSTLSGLSALDGLTNLQALNFSQNNEPAITTHLAALTNLTSLDLMGNKIQDVSGLSTLTKLKHLILANNKVGNITPLFGLTQLEVLNLMTNDLDYVKDSTATTGTDKYFNSFDGAFDSADNLVWPSLTKLNISGNSNWGMRVFSETGKLFRHFQQANRELIFDYNYIYEYTEDGGYPYTTAKLDALVTANGGYITYDDLGAYHDGVRDDYGAMVNAHDYANAKGCEVRATAGRTYHIFNPYDLSYHNIYTSTDWRGATFVIHDEHVDDYASRYTPLFCVRPSASTSQKIHKDIVTLATSDSSLTINAGQTLSKSSTSVAGISPELTATLTQLNTNSGYTRFYLMVYNDNKMQYKRYNASSSMAQWDGIVVDKDGNIEIPKDGQGLNATPVQWDFSDITKIVVTPIPNTRAHIRNGTFVSLAPISQQEAANGRGSKPIYYLRNLQVRETAGVDVSNVRQWVSESATTLAAGDSDKPSGSYSGFLHTSNAADITVTDCSVWARKIADDGRSTYGVSFNYTTNLTVTRLQNSNTWEQMLDMQRWGVMQSNHVKNVVFDTCTLSRIDAHEGFYNMTARDCKLGSWGFRLTGQGPLNIIRCDVTATTFAQLRMDYGSTWDGDARIVDCTHHYMGTYAQSVISASPAYDSDGSIHDFGYPLHYPNLYIKNLTVDEERFTHGTSFGRENYYIIPNTSYNNLHLYPAEYWPDSVVVDGINFVNYEDSVHFKPPLRLVNTEGGGIVSKMGAYTVSNVTYNGVGEHNSLDSGTALSFRDAAHTLPMTITSADNKGNAVKDFGPSVMDGKELAIEYVGAVPRITLFDASWKGGISVDPYLREDTGRTDSSGNEIRVAYFCEEALDYQWATKQATDSSIGAYYYLRVTSWDSTELLRMVVLDAITHVHSWGAWTETTAPTCTEAGVETRVCATDSSHVETRTGRAALGHDWSVWTVVVQPTATEPGTEKSECSRCGTETTREVPATGEEPGGDEPGGDVPGGGGDEPGGDEPGGSGDEPGGDEPGGETQVSGWAWENGTWRYYLADADGSFATGWLWDAGVWYYLEVDGAMRRGWLWDDAWFYLKGDGALYQGWLLDGGFWYHLHTEHDGWLGAMDDGWLCEAGDWYFLNPDDQHGYRGRMLIGWVWDGGAWYYLRESGAMLRSSWTPDGCYVNNDGVWVA